MPEGEEGGLTGVDGCMSCIQPGYRNEVEQRRERKNNCISNHATSCE